MQMLDVMESNIPPVTRMTLPERLPISLSGLNDLPIPILFIDACSSGIMKPKPRRMAVVGSSKIWRKT